MRVGNQAALQELAERIAQADAVVIGGGSGLSSAAGYDHYHWSPALFFGYFPRNKFVPFRETLATANAVSPAGMILGKTANW